MFVSQQIKDNQKTKLQENQNEQPVRKHHWSTLYNVHDIVWRWTSHIDTGEPMTLIMSTVGVKGENPTLASELHTEPAVVM